MRCLTVAASQAAWCDMSDEGNECDLALKRMTEGGELLQEGHAQVTLPLMPEWLACCLNAVQAKQQRASKSAGLVLHVCVLAI